jgi:hypothetical protein
MIPSSPCVRILFVVLALACATGVGRAADIAFDSAGDSAYNNGWTNGSNGGYGWGGGWMITALPAGAVIGDSTTNGNGDLEGDGDINSPRVAGGRAWDLPGGIAIRMFSGPLSVGQTFSIDYDVDEQLISPNWDRGFDFLAPGGGKNSLIYFGFGAGGQISGPTIPTVLTGIANDGAGLHIAFTELSSGVDVSITPYAPGATTSDFFVPYIGEIVGIRMTGIGTGNLTPVSATSYFNNISITPEPSSAAVLGLAAFAVIARRRRR